MTHLHRRLEQATSGSRQVAFITGEAGIGKTTLVEAFLDALNQTDTLLPIWVGRGQCIEQHGAGEAYMPVLEALERLCRRPDGERLLTILDQHAPTWLGQLPSLLEPAELEALHRRIQGVTRERMLREMAKAVEIVTAEVTLVLVLEDLQWSDHSTIFSPVCLSPEARSGTAVCTRHLSSSGYGGRRAFSAWPHTRVADAWVL